MRRDARDARPDGTARTHLTRGGRLALLGAVALLFGGGTSGQVTVAAAGALVLGLVGGALLAVRRAVPTLDALRFDLDGPDAGAIVRGAPVRLGLTVTNPTARPLRDVRLRLLLAGDPKPPPRLAMEIPPRARGRTPLTFALPRAGHWRTHGLELRLAGPLSVSFAERYVPLERALTVRPARLPASALARLLAPVGAARDREGRHPTRRPGGGLELRELRDYVPGDPLKIVAWKATARRQRPLVRSFEEETVRRLQILLDMGPTMRAGGPGAAPLDRATDLAASLIDANAPDARGDDRVGLTTFDLRVYGHVWPAVGREHARRLLHHLMDLSRVVDEDLTEITDAELLALVGRFLERQRGLDLRAHTEPDRPRVARTLSDPLWELYDPGDVFAVVNAYLAEDRDRGNAALFAKGRPAEDLIAARLRLFCALQGLPLPYRLTGPADGRERGLAAAVARLSHGRGGGAADTLLLLSDLRGLSLSGPGVRALRLAVANNRRVVVIRLGDPDDEDTAAVVAALRAGRISVVDGRRYSAPGNGLLPPSSRSG